MRTEPLFNIETPENPYELKSVEKNNFPDKDKSKEDEPFRAKDLEDEEKRKVLPPDPFGKKGNKIDILG